MLKREAVLMGRDKQAPLTPEIEQNLEKLLFSVNEFLKISGLHAIVSSGYRPGIYNTKAGGALKSPHMVCMAVDLVDKDSTIDQYCMKNLTILKQCGLYLEHPKWTKGWCHLDIKPRKNRVFIPYNREPEPQHLDICFL